MKSDMAGVGSIFDKDIYAQFFRGKALLTARTSLTGELLADGGTLSALQKRYFFPNLPSVLRDQGYMTEYQVEEMVRELPVPNYGNFFCFIGLPLREIQKKNPGTPAETDLLLLHPRLGVVLIEVKSVGHSSSPTDITGKEEKGQEQLEKTKAFFKIELGKVLKLSQSEREKLPSFFKAIPAFVAMPNVNEEVTQTGEAKLLLQPFFDGGPSAQTTLFKEPSDSDKKLYEKVYPWMLSMCYHLKTYKEHSHGKKGNLKEKLHLTFGLVERNTKVLPEWYLRCQKPSLASNHGSLSPEELAELAKLALLDPLHTHSSSKVLFITGDSGSGKTYILAEKISELLKKPGNKCFYVAKNRDLVDKIHGSVGVHYPNFRCITYEQFFDDCRIVALVGEAVPDGASIEDIMVGRVVSARIIAHFSDHHFFFDAFQDLSEKLREVIAETLLRGNPKDKLRWTSFDNSQHDQLHSGIVQVPLQEDGTLFPLITLPAVYRLTVEIYKVLCFLKVEDGGNFNRDLRMALPVASRENVEFGLIDMEECAKANEVKQNNALLSVNIKWKKLSELLQYLTEVEQIPLENIMVLLDYSCSQAKAIRTVCGNFKVNQIINLGDSKGFESRVVIACFPNPLEHTDPWTSFRIAASRAIGKLFILTTFDTYQELNRIFQPYRPPRIVNAAHPDFLFRRKI